MSAESVYLNGEFLPLDEATGSGARPRLHLRRRRLRGDPGLLAHAVPPARAPRAPAAAAWTRSASPTRTRDARVARAHPGARRRARRATTRRVYIQVTRGVRRSATTRSRRAVEPDRVHDGEPAVHAVARAGREGRRRVTAQDFRWLRCDIKSISLLGNCLLRQMAADAGAVETILFRDGFLTEASASNVFVVKDGVIAVAAEEQPDPARHHLRRRASSSRASTACRCEIRDDRAKPRCAPPTSSGSPRRRRKCWRSSTLDGKPVGDGQARPGVRAACTSSTRSSRQTADARRQARPHRLRAPAAPGRRRACSTFPCDFPIKMMGTTRAGLRAGGGRRRHAPRAGLRRRPRSRCAPAAKASTCQPHLHRARALRASSSTRCTGAVRSPDGGRWCCDGDGRDRSARRDRAPSCAARARRVRADLARRCRRSPRRATRRHADELWLLEHPPVYTLGLAGRPRAPARAGRHPGRDASTAAARSPTTARARSWSTRWSTCARRGLKVRELVRAARAGGDRPARRDTASAERRAGAPGVYVGGAKIAALGLRVATRLQLPRRSRSTSTWTSRPSPRSIPAAIPALRVTQMPRPRHRRLRRRTRQPTRGPHRRPHGTPAHERAADKQKGARQDRAHPDQGRAAGAR